MKALITQAILSHRLLCLNHAGKTQTIEPHVCGLTLGNEDAMLGWQVQPLDTGGGHWRLFRLDDISDMRLLDEPIRMPPGGRRPDLDLFSIAYAIL